MRSLDFQRAADFHDILEILLQLYGDVSLVDVDDDVTFDVSAGLEFLG